MIHLYKAYGLNIASTLLFPEMIEYRAGIPDLYIRFGKVPKTLNTSKLCTNECQIAAKQILFRFENLANYLVSNGTEILIEPHPLANEADIRFYALGLCMSLILHQREFLVLHASAIQVPGGCIAFMAPSGYGKSTLAAAFYQRGFPVLTDDICAVRLRPKKSPEVESAIPQLKLSEASAKKLNICYEHLPPLPNKEKYAFGTQENFIKKAQPLLHIYQLGRGNREDISLQPLSGISKFCALKNHTSHQWILGAMNLQAQHFSLCTTLQKQVPLSQLIRPTSGFQLEELVDFLLAKFKNFRQTHNQGRNG
jgi:hypothetical protein